MARRKRGRSSRWSSLPGADRARRFFVEANFDVTVWDSGLAVNGLFFEAPEGSRSATFIDWNGLIDRFVLAHFPRRFSEAIKQFGPTFGEAAEERQLDDGVEVRSGDDLLLRLHPTSASVPGERIILGNYLTRGEHWDRLDRAIVRREAVLAAGLDDQTSLLLRTLFPGAAPLVQVGPPEEVSGELLHLCLVASEKIRLHRSLALERPVSLHMGGVRLRFMPVIGPSERLLAPFSIDLEELHAEALCCSARA